jgi:hypothetical protein
MPHEIMALNQSTLRRVRSEGIQSPLSDWTTLLGSYLHCIRNCSEQESIPDLLVLKEIQLKQIGMKKTMYPPLAKSTKVPLVTITGGKRSNNGGEHSESVRPNKKFKNDIILINEVANENQELFVCRAKHSRKQGNNQWKPFSAPGKLRVFRNQDGKCKMVLWDGAGKVRMNLFVAKNLSFQKGRSGTIYFMSMADISSGLESFVVKVGPENVQPLCNILMEINTK